MVIIRENIACVVVQHGTTTFSPPCTYIYIYIFVICWLVGVSWGITASDKAACFQFTAGCSPQSDTDY